MNILNPKSPTYIDLMVLKSSKSETWKISHLGTFKNKGTSGLRIAPKYTIIWQLALKKENLRLQK
jgi:hypothetical protein